MGLDYRTKEKLSDLDIDVDKDWATKKIENLGAPNSGDDAKRHDSDPATHGADKHTNVTRELFLPAIAAHTAYGTPRAYYCYAVVEGAANADEPHVYFTMKVPDDFVSFISVKAIWFSAAVSGNMRWRIAADFASCGEICNANNSEESLGYGQTATGGDRIINCQLPVNALTLPALAKGDHIGLVFNRQGSSASDTLDTSVELMGLLFTYTAEQ